MTTPPSPTADFAGLRLSRRRFLGTTGAVGLLAALDRLAPPYARALAQGVPHRPSVAPGDGSAAVDLTIRETAIRIGTRRAAATAINGTVPGPLLRFREGEEVKIRVTNQLREDTSVHWHGVLVPNGMDGVPGVTFPGIRPGETFTYRFPLRQYGTYWYHSHSGLQEQLGHYGPLIIDPAEPEPFAADREYVVMLSDWPWEDPYEILDKLKKQSDYYNFQRLTVPDFVEAVRRRGLRAALRDRLMWGRMRMSPVDISDVTGAVYTYLVNGMPPEANWTGLFRPGERVRLRFINAGAGTYFDVRIPGLEMTVVEVSGQWVQPMRTDEFRLEIAQTLDVIVQPTADIAYTIFAESVDRSGYARGTLAPRPGMAASIPARRPRPVLTMADMGMAIHMDGMEGMEGMAMAGTDFPRATPDSLTDGHAAMPGMHAPGADSAAGRTPGHDMATMPRTRADSTETHAGGTPGHDAAGHATAGRDLPPRRGGQRLPDGSTVYTSGLRPAGTVAETVEHGPETHGVGNAAVPATPRSRLAEPGPGLGTDGWRVLVYADLRALRPRPDALQPPTREIELHLTGNMERFMWSINGIKFSDVREPIRLERGARYRLTIVNDTMMAHPMHLHGMWMELENGTGGDIPRVHTIDVKPADRVSVLVTPEDPGPWAFHCHVLNHMVLGMFRVFEVADSVAERGR